MGKKLRKIILGTLLAMGVVLAPMGNIQAADITADNKAATVKEPTVSEIRNLAPESEAEYRAAFACLKKKDLEGALRHADKLVALEPQKAFPYRLRAQIYGDFGKYETGIEDIKKVLEIKPEDYLAAIQLGNYYMYSGNRELAAEAYKKATVIKPDDLMGYLSLSAIQLQFKQYEGAIQNANTMIQLEPEVMVSYDIRGIAYNKLEKYTEGYQDLKHFIAAMEKGLSGKAAYGIISMSVNAYFAYYNLGEAACKLKKYPEGIDNYTKALKFSPNSVEALLERANAYYEVAKYDLAIQDADRAIQLQPKGLHTLLYAYSTKGAVYCKQKKYEASLKEYETNLAELEKVYPDLYKSMRPAILNDMAYAYMGMKQYDKAEGALKESLAYTRDTINLDTYGELLERMERFEESDKIYQEAIGKAKSEDIKKDTIEHYQRMKKAWEKKK